MGACGGGHGALKHGGPPVVQSRLRGAASPRAARFPCGLRPAWSRSLRRSLPRSVMMACLVSALALALVEGSLRLVEAVARRDWTVSPLPDPPSYDVLCESGGYYVLCPDKGRDYERVRPERFAGKRDRPRVIAIGESFVYGLGLATGEAWPARLAALLPGTEVLNFGRCGTYAGRLIPVLDAALAAHPDVVVLAVGNNEHTMTSYYTGWAGRHPLLTYALAQRLGSLRIYGLLHGLIDSPHIAESFEAANPDATDVDRLVASARRRPPNLTGFGDPPLAGPEVTAALEEEQRLKERIFGDWMREMVRRTRAAGAVPILATLPVQLTTPPTLSGVHAGDAATVRALLAELSSGQYAGDRRSRADVVSAGLREDPRVAEFLYADGMADLALGDEEAGAARLRDAVEWDMIPDITPSLNAIIRDVASTEGCALVDLDTLSDRALRDPAAMFLDRVHVDAAGADAVAALLAPSVKSALMVR